MKVPPKNIDGFVKKLPTEIQAVLVYGPDEGLVRERMDILAKNIVADIRDPFNVAEFSGKQLTEDPARLTDEIFSISMLGGRRVVRVHGAGDDIASSVKDTLSSMKDGDNFLVVGAGELTPRSSLRLLFENGENIAAIPCYVEDERDLGRVISESLKAAGYSIPSDAVAYMASNVIGDRGMARSEVEKLITYMGEGNKRISLDDVIECVGDSASLSLDGLAKSVASGNFKEAETILNSVLSEGLPAVAILRNLQNYFMRLHITKSRIQQGETMESATRKLKPPPFFKVKAAFESQVMNWSLGQMEQALALLTGVEAKCKQTASDPYTLCSRAILSLSKIGERTKRRA